MTDTSSPGTDKAKASPWAPFGYPAFALLWSATLISNTGTWMHDVGAGWLMTSLSPSPAIVALVQAATTAPVFLFALFAGALADRLNKKRLLIIVNGIMFAIAACLAILVYAEQMTPGLLVLFTFLLGTGAAFIAPAWQAIVPTLVPRDALQSAISLNSMGINISRAIGPAVAGFLIAAIGVAAPFALNAVSFVMIIIALFIWKPQPKPESALPPEPLFSSMLTGLRHAANNDSLKATLLRAFGFFTFASAYWALLPLIAKNTPGGGAELYGLLLASIGAAAVAGAFALPFLKKRFDANALVAGGSIGTALAMGLLAVSSTPNIAIGAAILGGLSWIIVLTCLNVSAQTSLPNWVRARGLAILLMVFFGSMAAGSTVWGQVATIASTPTALMIAAAGLLLAIPLTWRAKLGQGEDQDLSPSMHWQAAPIIVSNRDALDRGPVLITIEYEIDPTQETPFLSALRSFSRERFRDGAHEWRVYQDTENDAIWIEWFRAPSWAEHLRQHERVTKHDQDLQAEVIKYHVGANFPRVRHFLAPDNTTNGDP